MPVHEPGKPEPRGLQLWVDLPKQYKMVEPSYQELEPEKYVGFLGAYLRDYGADRLSLLVYPARSLMVLMVPRSV